jgi:hypothetical protein
MNGTEFSFERVRATTSTAQLVYVGGQKREKVAVAGDKKICNGFANNSAMYQFQNDFGPVSTSIQSF